MPTAANRIRPAAFAAVLCAVIVLLASAGCQSLAVPRIDPTGEQIFLPPPNYTTLEAPLAPGSGEGLTCLPAPAYQTPPTPPPCPAAAVPAVAAPGALLGPPSSGTPLPAQATVPATRLVLTPTRIVAPLESQVVLIAGVCGPNNRYLGGEQVEWFLSKDSPGHFLELEGEHVGGIGRALHPLPKKVSADYAVGKTTVGGRLISRGRDQKVWLREGQTWVTLTSATEGVSRVTAFSPDGESSPARQETAEIYWVDVQYTFPTVAPVRAGDPAYLTTKLQRASNGLPLAGWLVRYKFAGGNAVGIGPNGQQEVDVITDRNGYANVNVTQQVAAPGTSDIRVTILRPAAADGEPDRIPIESRVTTIPWSAAGLKVQTVGPAAVTLGSTADYQVEVTNTGDLPSDGVTAQLEIPAGMRLIAADPQPQIFGDRLEWNLGTLQPMSRDTLNVQLMCEQQGEFNVCSSAQSATGDLSDRSCASTGVYRPAVRVEMFGPETAEVGETIQFNVRVTNEGQLPLRNVVVIDRYDPGLNAPAGEGPLQRFLGDLEPGGVRQIGVPFQVVAAGQLRNRVEVTTEGGHTASAERMVNAVEPQRPPPGSQPPVTPPESTQLEVNATGSSVVREGETASYQVVVTNRGNVTLSNVQIVFTHAPTLTANAAGAGFQRDAAANQVSWTVGELAPGDSVRRRMTCRALRQDPNSGVSAVAVADNAPAVRREVATRIEPAQDQPPAGTRPPAGGNPGAGTPTPATPPAAGSLKISIADRKDAVSTGETAFYDIVIHNDSNASDRDVALTVTLPAAARFDSITGPPTGALRTDGRVIELPPLTQVRPNEKLEFVLKITYQQTGNHSVNAQVRSRRSAQGVSASESTTVVGQ